LLLSIIHRPITFTMTLPPHLTYLVIYYRNVNRILTVVHKVVEGSVGIFGRLKPMLVGCL